jgi:hypothetical protein
MESVESRITPRFFTEGERGTVASASISSEAEKVESFCLVPVRMASVLSLFSFNLFSVMLYQERATVFVTALGFTLVPYFFHRKIVVLCIKRNMPWCCK